MKNYTERLSGLYERVCTALNNQYNRDYLAISEAVKTVGTTWAEENNLMAMNAAITNIGPENLTPKLVADYNEHIFYVYPLRVEDRAAFRSFLEERGVTTGVYFPVPMHEQACFAGLGYKHGDFPVAEDLAEHGVTIPMFPELTDEEIQTVIDAVNAYAN